MSYTALYRKYRPQNFDSVIGQDHIVKTLKNQMTSGRVSHAYLFCGTRGTGKTSTAKIFARALNCLEPVDGEPCNKCQLCMGNTMNVIEIDAASNNGVDNIREIREEVKYPPAQGKYKVYIIDEVHMLSIGAFNALLKTLEEPPAHVVFILATTDPQKVPATILSRVQRFDFRRISTDDIVSALKGYMSEEVLSVEDNALKYIATLGDGSMRDSLSILDQCLAFYHDQVVTLENVMDIIGSVDHSVFFELTYSLLKKDSATAMKIVDDIVMKGRDITQFVTELIVHFRNLMVAATMEKPENVLDLSEENINKFKEQSKSATVNEILYYIKVFSGLLGELRYTSNGRIILEVCLLKLCTPQSDNSGEAVLARLDSMEREIKSGNFKQVVTVNQTKDEKPKPRPKPKPKALPSDIAEVKKAWGDICLDFDPILRSFGEKTEIGTMESDGIVFICDNHVVSDKINKSMEIIKDMIEERFKKDFEINVVTKEEYDNWHNAKYGSDEEEYTDLNGIGDIFPDAEFED